MKKLVLLLTLLPFFTFSQNWHPFPDNQTSYFRKASNSYGLQVIKIDSIKETENGKIYFNRRSPLHIETTEDYALYDPYQSWIGYSTLLDDDKVIFQNKNAEPISIYLNTDILESWLFYTFENGEYIEAWLESVENINILEDLIDEVKIFKFQAYNADGNTVDNGINSDSIILSKNYGFIRTFKWVKFPQIIPYQLWGIENSNAIHGEHYDLDELSKGYTVGDEIHLYYNSQYQKIDEYVGKRLTETNVEYDIKTTTPNYGSISYETKRYNFGDLPGESKFDENGVFLGFKSIKVSSEAFQGKHKYTIASYGDFEWVEYEGNFYWGREWSSSLGSDPFKICNSFHYYDNICNGDGDCWDMVYVNNTNGEWGEPLEFEVKPYTMIRPDMINYFAGHDFFGSETILGTRIDTIEQTGYGVTRYYNYKTGEKYYYDEEREYVDPKGSWTGMYHEIDLNGVTSFFNEKYEPIVFYPKAEVGFEWQAYNEDGEAIDCHIISLNYQEILPGLMDTVKIIGVSTKAEGKRTRAVLRLSKNYGLLDMPNFYRTRFNYIRNIKSIKTEEAFYGFDYQIDEIINGLEVGQKLHYSFSDEYHWFQIKRELIAKTYFPQKIEYVYKRYQLVDQNWPVDTSYYQLIYDTIDYPQNCMPGELILDQDIFGREFRMEIRYDTTEHCEVPLRRLDIFPNHRRNYIERDGRILMNMTEHNDLSRHYNNDFVDQVGHYKAFQHDTYLGYDHIKYIESPNLTCGEPYLFNEEDYQVIRPEYKTYYQVYNGLYGIRIDSMEVHNNYIRYYNYPNPQRYEYADAEYYTDPNASWLGMYVDVFGNGDNIFYDQDYTPFNIKTKADIGDSWIASEYSWGTINASIISKEYHEIFPDLFDSIKWVRLTYNDQELDLRLSKNFGLIDFPSFYRFYLPSPFPSLVGIESEEELVGTNFSMNEIINSLEVGDEIHYRNSAFYGSFFKRKVLDKILTDKKVSYIYEVCGQISETHPIDTTYYTYWTDSVAFPINIMPNEIVMDTSVFGSEFCMGIGNKVYDYTCTDVNGFRFSCYVKDYEFEVDGRVFWHTIPYDNYSKNALHVFAEGIGDYIGPRSDSDADYEVIDYYHNNSFSCGEAYEISCNSTGLEELIISNITISPNPSSGIFNIQSSKKIEEAKVYNLNGQIVWQVDKLNETQIDLTSLPEGLYILELKTTGQHLIHQKVLISK